MPAIGAPLRKWTFFLLLCSIPTCGFAQRTNETAGVEPSTVSGSKSATRAPAISPSPPKSSASSSPESACPFRTINYITHTLPQQCLRTSWSAPGQPASAEGSIEGEPTPSPQVVIPWAIAGAPESGEVSQREDAQPKESHRPEETGASDAATASTTRTEPEVELETDSPLDNANFLSFEEWKKKNLARAGQSPDNVGQGRAASSQQGARRRPVNVNALDSLGEESELEIDFSGFVSPSEGDQGDQGVGSTPPETQGASELTPSSDEQGKVAPSSWALSKDAGKTCKERFNYASFDCAATILKTNKQAKSSSSVLVENKDSYMLNECSAENKFMIVELCDDILVDTIVLANYEFFSSMFRHFRVSVSDRYPVKMDRWRVLGTFEARNSREIQPFLVTEPQIWARYLRVEFLTHYGNEFYCPMSLLRVHGTTMMEQFRREEEQARGDDDFAEPIEAADGDPVQTALVNEGEAVPPDQLPIEVEKDTTSAIVPSEVGNSSEPPEPTASPSQANETGPHPSASDSASAEAPDVAPSDSTVNAKEATLASGEPAKSSQSTPAAKSDPTEPVETSRSSSKGVPPAPSAADSPSSARSSSVERKSAPPTTASTQNKDAKPATNETAAIPSSSAPGKVAANSTNTGSQAQSRASSQTQPNPAAPSTQESFFKSIHKRLQYLEANSTLSLQYIEEQSRILRDAFMKVEKKQLQKTEKFLDHLNSTVMHELKSYRNMYDQLWQSTILELEGMKERQKAEIGEIGARLSMVADELVWQKRMAVVQSTLLLLCLGLVLFVRSGTLGSQTDIPIVQQLGNTYSSFFDSPPHSPESSRSLRRRRTFRNMWRRDTSASAALSDRSGHMSDAIHAVSDAETDGRRSPVQIAYSPPTPVTSGMPSDGEKGVASSPEQLDGFRGEDHDTGLPTPTEEVDPSVEDLSKRIEVLETQSGPATPRGSRDNRPSWEEVDRAVDLLRAEERGQRTERERELNREKKQRRSPLRRAESYDGGGDDSPEDSGAEGLFLSG